MKKSYSFHKKPVLPKLFSCSGIHSGIKENGNLDLGLFYSEVPCNVAGVFTANQIKAAPVYYCLETLKLGKNTAQAVLINSGNANAANGSDGYKKTTACAKLLSEQLHLSLEKILVCSTGRIGEKLPITPFKNGIKPLLAGLSTKNLENSARAMMTTDTFPKFHSLSFFLPSDEKSKVTITSFTKGAGMIHPNMATMLSFVFTDAKISKADLNYALKKAVNSSFNRISVDGDMSTNDTVLLLANSEASNKNIKRNSKDFDIFLEALSKIAKKQALQILEDGEGATKIVKLNLKGAKTLAQATLAVKSLSKSLLLKCALNGADPNWGRILSTLGATENLVLKEDKVTIAFEDIIVYNKGNDINPSQKRLDKICNKSAFNIFIDLGLGKGEDFLYINDLSKDYVDINMKE